MVDRQEFTIDKWIKSIKDPKEIQSLLTYEQSKQEAIKQKIALLQWLDDEMKPYKEMYAVILGKLQKDFDDDLNYEVIYGKTKERETNRDGVEL